MHTKNMIQVLTIESEREKKVNNCNIDISQYLYSLYKLQTNLKLLNCLEIKVSTSTDNENNNKTTFSVYGPQMSQKSANNSLYYYNNIEVNPFIKADSNPLVKQSIPIDLKNKQNLPIADNSYIQINLIII